MVIWQTLIVAGTLLISCLVGWPLTAGVLRLAGAQNSKSGDSAPVLRGGTTIGLLERFATTGAILIGQPALIAVIAVVKGFGRFDQLKGDPVASEKFTIGTLCSLSWAVVVGVAGGGVLAIL